MDNTVNGSNQLPSAYKVAPGDDGRFYPMRFGCWRRDNRGNRLAFPTEGEAIAYCWQEQRDYEMHYPAPSDKSDNAATLVNTSDQGELEAHLVDAGDVPAPQPDGYYYLYKRNHRGKWDLTEESDAAVAATYRAYGYQDTTADDFQAKWLENRKRWQA